MRTICSLSLIFLLLVAPAPVVAARHAYLLGATLSQARAIVASRGFLHTTYRLAGSSGSTILIFCIGGRYTPYHYDDRTGTFVPESRSKPMPPGFVGPCRTAYPHYPATLAARRAGGRIAAAAWIVREWTGFDLTSTDVLDRLIVRPYTREEAGRVSELFFERNWDGLYPRLLGVFRYPDGVTQITVIPYDRARVEIWLARGQSVQPTVKGVAQEPLYEVCKQLWRRYAPH